MTFQSAPVSRVPTAVFIIQICRHSTFFTKSFCFTSNSLQRDSEYSKTCNPSSTHSFSANIPLLPAFYLNPCVLLLIITYEGRQNLKNAKSSFSFSF